MRRLLPLRGKLLWNSERPAIWPRTVYLRDLIGLTLTELLLLQQEHQAE
jgi:hypothetical protein